MRLRTLFLLVFLAGCGKSCNTGERVHVLYRGDVTLSEKGAVTRDKVALGYVESIRKSKDLQRVTLHLTQAGALRKGDRFLPSTDKGVTGFQVVAGEGEALRDGDEVEADPTFSKRAYYAELGKNSPGGITLPSGVFVPYPAGLTREAIDPRRSPEAKFKKDVTKRMKLPDDPKLNLNADVKARYQNLQAKLLEAGPTEALQILNTEGAALTEDLKKESYDAQMKKDRPTEQAARRMSQRIMQMQKKLTREAARDERTGPRKVREGYVPPDFR